MRKQHTASGCGMSGEKLLNDIERSVEFNLSMDVFSPLKKVSERDISKDI